MPITNTRPLKVFLCHAHADRDAVRALYARLTKDGVDAWLDKEKLVGGQNFEYEIRKAVRESDLIIVCLSKDFNKTGFRQKEVNWAIDTAMEKPKGEIFIIPARLEECETLDDIRHLHWVDLFENDGYENLKKALALRAERVGALLVNSRYSEFDRSKVEIFSLKGQANLFNNLASVCLRKGDMKKALEYFEQALELSREKNDAHSQSVISSNLGFAYWKLGDFSNARKYLRQSLALSQELGDRLAEISALYNLAYVYESVGDLVRAAELHERALLISKEIGL